MKIARIIISTIVLFLFVTICSFYVDIVNQIARSQFGPNFSNVVSYFQNHLTYNLGGSAIVVGVILVITLLFGRVYCAILCPLGIMQDFLMLIEKVLHLNKLKNHYIVAKKVWQFSIFIIVFGLFIGGITLPFRILEPFSIFGRIIVGIEQNLSTLLFALGVVFLTTFVMFTLFARRIYCNLLCPVGAILSIPAFFAVFKLKIDQDKCIKCKKCTKNCPGYCLDIEKKKLNFEHCLLCGNCIKSCPTHAISYAKNQKKIATDLSRRDLITLGSLGIFSIAIGFLFKKKSTQPAKTYAPAIGDIPILPPGAGSVSRFAAKCTACQICVNSCLGEVLQPNSKMGGQVQVSFESGMCEFNCKRCSEVCPSGAIKKLSLSEKMLTRIGLAEYHREICIPFLDGTECGACAEHCPTGALTMTDGPNGAKIPKLKESLCIGCGNCEYACPVEPYPAITVVGIQTQVLADDPAKIKPVEPVTTQNDEWAF